MPVSLEEQLDRLVAEARTANAPARYLNLGSGRDRRDGFVNVDIADLPEVDVVAAFGGEPLPFASNSFGVVLCRDILEHVEVVPALREVHRVLAPGGFVLISAVHFTSRNLYADPTHVRGFSARTFDYFANGATPEDRSYYFEYAFEEVPYAKIQFSALLGRGRWLIWDRLVEPLVNYSRITQDLYELTFASRLFPAANVIAVLRK